jgi:hypothetical protein
VLRELPLAEKSLSEISNDIFRNNVVYGLFDRSQLVDQAATVKERVAFEGCMLWIKFIIENQIEGLFFGTTPNSLSDFLLFKAGELLGLPVFSAYWNPVLRGMSYVMGPHFKVIRTLENDCIPIGPWLSNTISRSTNLARFIAGDNTYDYAEIVVTDILRSYLLHNSIAIREIINDPNGFMYFKSDGAIPLSKQMDFKAESYVCFFLHVEPESTTIPLGGAAIDQMLYVRLLRSFLPDDCLLVVKEHPYYSQKSVDSVCSEIGVNIRKKYRGQAFAAALQSIPNCIYIDHTNDGIDTVSVLSDQNCISTATISGTIAVESILAGLPCIALGCSPFEHSAIIQKLDVNLPVRIEKARNELSMASDRHREDLKKLFKGAINGRFYFETCDLPTISANQWEELQYLQAAGIAKAFGELGVTKN